MTIKGNPDLHRSGPWQHQLKDGSLIDVELTSIRLAYDGHDARLVLITDITERQRAEEALKDKSGRIDLAEAQAELVDGLLEPPFLFEDSEDLGAEVPAHLVVGKAPDDHALRLRQVGHDAVGESEEALATHPHHRMNPRSRASLVLARVKSRL